jgi:hypothetical protein
LAAYPPWRTRASLTGRSGDTEERRPILPLTMCVCAELKRDSAANHRMKTCMRRKVVALRMRTLYSLQKNNGWSAAWGGRRGLGGGYKVSPEGAKYELTLKV